MAEASCRVYWGSHACMYERGHPGPHECICRDVSQEDGGVGKPPYYGPSTMFYGEDAEEAAEATSRTPDELNRDLSTRSRIGRVRQDLRTRLALRIAPWLAPDYEARMKRLMERHIAAHRAIISDREPAETTRRDEPRSSTLLGS